MNSTGISSSWISFPFFLIHSTPPYSFSCFSNFNHFYTTKWSFLLLTIVIIKKLVFFSNKNEEKNTQWQINFINSSRNFMIVHSIPRVKHFKTHQLIINWKLFFFFSYLILFWMIIIFYGGWKSFFLKSFFSLFFSSFSISISFSFTFF